MGDTRPVGDGGWSLALIQDRASCDVEENRDRAAAAVRQAAGADLVVFPELATIDPGCPDGQWAAAAEPLDGPTVARLSAAARHSGTAVVIGLLEAAEPRPFNTVAVIDSAGELVAAYRKMHLFDALGVTETDSVQAGPAEPCVVDVGGHRLGLMTCYDIRFPELARRLCADGATLLVVPAAWYAGPMKLEQWRTLLTARAVENTVFVAAADQCGPPFTGHSLMVDPSGRVVAEAAEAPEALRCRLDWSEVSTVRAAMPSLRHRRLGLSPPR